MKKYIFTFLSLCLFFTVNACTSNTEMTAKKEISAQEVIKLLQKGKDIVLSQKIITGDLDFTKATAGTEELKNVYTHYLNASIVFKNCEFKGKIVSSQLKEQELHRTFFMKNLSFMQCIFHETVEIKQSTVQGIVNFSESVFNKNISLETSVFQSSVFLDKTTLQQGGRFQNTLFQQDFSCLESIFYDMVSFQKAVFKGNMMCTSTQFHGNLDMGLTTFHGPFLFNYNVLKLKSSFNRMNCRDKFECLNTKFEQDVTCKEAIFEKMVKWVDNTMTTSDFSRTILYQTPIGTFPKDTTIQVIIKN